MTKDPVPVVAYIRISTDDKDQKPDRQLDFFERWGAENGYVVVAHVVDEGTSATKVPPLQRPKVHDAIRLAHQHGARGLLVQDLDRWSRGGNREVAVTDVRMEMEFGLDVIMADLPSGIEGVAYEIIKTLKAEMAREYTKVMGERIRQGLRAAKKRGWPRGKPGRPAKPSISATELEMVVQEARNPQGMGLERLAHRISTMRGAYDAADPARQRELVVRETWLRRELARAASKMPEVKEPLFARWPALARLKVDVEEGSR